MPVEFRPNGGTFVDTTDPANPVVLGTMTEDIDGNVVLNLLTPGNLNVPVGDRTSLKTTIQQIRADDASDDSIDTEKESVGGISVGRPGGVGGDIVLPSLPPASDELAEAIAGAL